MTSISNFLCHSIIRRFDLRTLATVVLSISALAAHAAPLDKATCAKLTQDMQNMKALDVDKLMEKGPSWAVSHLSPGDLNLVRQYIDLDEQMKFRCSAPGSLVHLKHLEDEDDESGPKPPAEASDNQAETVRDAAGNGENAPKAKQTPVRAQKKPKQPAQASSGDGAH